MADIKSAFTNYTDGNYIQAEVELKEILTTARDNYLKTALELAEDEEDKKECDKKKKKDVEEEDKKEEE